MSEARKGIVPWNKGRKATALEADRLRGLRIGKTPWCKGMKMSEDFCKKNSEAQLKSERLPRGEKHWNWKGGTTKFRHHVMELAAYKKWRQAVFERDDFTCECGKRGGELHADHKVSFREIVERFGLRTIADAINCAFLWDVENGKTLCVPCHRLTPTFGFH